MQSRNAQMKQNLDQLNRVVAITALTAVTLGGQIVLAKAHRSTEGYKILAETNLGVAKTTSMFLRQDRRGHEFLYVASDAGILSIFDVSDPAEPRKVNDLRLTGLDNTFRVRPVSDRIALATRAADSAENLSVVDLGNGPSAKVARQFKNADAYTLDNASNTAYVAAGGKLVVMRFDHPITHDTEVWQKFYEER
jgi:hypothetical protein